MNRRELMIGSALTAASLAPATRALAQLPASPPAANPAGAELNALFDRFVAEQLDISPEFATALGFDKGPRAAEKSRLDDFSLHGRAEGKALVASQLQRLRAFDRSRLVPADQISYDVVAYVLNGLNDADRRFDYGGNYGNAGAGQPYVISQLTGAYQGTPDFLDSQHTIENKADADAYISRLNLFAPALDGDLECLRHDVGLGVIPPDFILDRTLTQLTELRGQAPDQSNLVQSVVRRTKQKNIPGDYLTPATRIYVEKVQPALDRQIAAVRDLRARAVHDAGVWRLPQGPEYYQVSLHQSTTTNLSPAEVHQTGLDLVNDYTAQIDGIMKANGLTQGSVGQRLRAMYQDPKFRYPNTDQGKEKLIADLNVKVQAVRAKLPPYFGHLPKADLLIKRVPKAIEAGAPGGYYQGAALDGSRPGIYWINLRDTAEVPSWTLPTLTYHEGIPGHHLQISLAQESTSIPLIRRIIGFNAYQEGWALYAEQLAVEMGMYAGDPWGHIGQLHDAMFRAVRLVVDTGMHAQRWSREQAIRYYVDTLGDQDASAATEVERYCVWPGQACSYMIGKLDWLKNRDKAKAALGPRFDIRTFHDAGLLNGAMPLQVLDTVMDGYIRAQQA